MMVGEIIFHYTIVTSSSIFLQPSSAERLYQCGGEFFFGNYVFMVKLGFRVLEKDFVWSSSVYRLLYNVDTYVNLFPREYLFCALLTD
jgi:hypothetical protein